uniref:hypothetical protein n=1 Tax=Streptomyces anulatus TaxID=1892 RepID=UPI002F91508A
MELLITGAELARLRGDEAEHTELPRAVDAARHLDSQRLTARLARLAANRAPDEF